MTTKNVSKKRATVHKSVRLDGVEWKVERVAERLSLDFSSALRYLITTHPETQELKPRKVAA